MIDANGTDPICWPLRFFAFALSPENVESWTLTFIQQKQIGIEVFRVGLSYEQKRPSTRRALTDGFLSNFVSFLAVINQAAYSDNGRDGLYPFRNCSPIHNGEQPNTDDSASQVRCCASCLRRDCRRDLSPQVNRCPEPDGRLAVREQQVRGLGRVAGDLDVDAFNVVLGTFLFQEF
jgi:hypothetical protein